MAQYGHVHAICCRPEVTDDVISGQDVETFLHFIYVNLLVASLSSFQEKIEISHLIMLKQRRVHLSPLITIKKKKMSDGLQN